MIADSYSVKTVSWGTAEAAIRAARDTVFVNKQGTPPELEWDGRDGEYTHVRARDTQGNPVGTGRINSQGHIGRMAVLSPWRGQGVGGAILDRLLKIALDLGLNEVCLDAQTSVVGFYTKHGFVPEGGVHHLAGIEHQKTRRKT